MRIGLVSNAQGGRGELLRWVLLSLGLPAPPEATYVDLFGRFQEHLIAEYAAGRRVLLIFDEAQNLGREALEELRMYTNINSNKRRAAAAPAGGPARAPGHGPPARHDPVRAAGRGELPPPRA